MTAHVRWLASISDRADHAIPPGTDRALCGRIATWYQSTSTRERCHTCQWELACPTRPSVHAPTGVAA